MSGTAAPRVLSIPSGAPFLPTLVDALLAGQIVPGFRDGGDPLALAGVTVYVPTRRAARELRTLFVARSRNSTAILPTIRPLGEFDEDEAPFEPGAADALDLAPPIPPLDRLLALAGLVRAWKRRLPAHVAQRFSEGVVVPASSADAIWLARDLAALMDEVETEGADWSKLAALAPESLAGWWQVTLDFLAIVTEHWPLHLAALGQSNPAAHRSALIRLEAERLRWRPPDGPVIAAGSTGSIPATAELLAAIARLPDGAVVLPGLDRDLDDRSWGELDVASPEPPLLGHPQFGLAKLLRRLGLARRDVAEIGRAEPALAGRQRLVSEAMRPAATTDGWAARRAAFADAYVAAALDGVTLLEAPRERDEAAAIALALRLAARDEGARAALVTGDRELARRVAADLLRFGIVADDSGGMPLGLTPPAALLRLLVEAAFRPGDPVPVLALLKHPLLSLGFDRPEVRRAAETIELVALRGGTGRPDLAELATLFESRLTALSTQPREPFWLRRMDERRLAGARAVLDRLTAAVAPLATLRAAAAVGIAEVSRATVVAVEALGRGAGGGLAELYAGAAGEGLAGLLRGLVETATPFHLPPAEWPDVLAAMLDAETVKPPPGAERRIAIWGQLEARLQTVDTLVIGGLNEGTWPRRAESDRFLSRLMKSGLSLEPPERRIGQSAHDFAMAAGTRNLVLTRSARSGEAPSVPSRWLLRLLTFTGERAAKPMRARGDALLAWARDLDAAGRMPFAARPNPTPPVEVRPTHFSVTEIETLRRDPYAVYARRILRLSPLEPLLREPGAAERGTLFHEVLHRFSSAGVDPDDPAALPLLIETGRACFAELALPPDVEAVWWPRFVRLAENVLGWEAARDVSDRRAEAQAGRTPVGRSGVTLSGRADRIDLRPAGMADLLDYKTGHSPSKAQAHTLLAPQLALEAALLRRGAFRDLGAREPADLAYVRLKTNGDVVHESILRNGQSMRTAADLAEDAWARLEALFERYRDRSAGYLSRALPFREGDMDGDYDHLARVLEWSAGAAEAEEGGE